MKSFLGTASGRVNLIGEHTDYNGGFVLPTAIPQQTRVEVTPTGDRQVILESANVNGKPARFEYELGQETRRNGWMDYLQGTTRILTQEGAKLGGFRARIESHVPMGSGLSSSAALEISFMRALRSAFDLKWDDVKLAQFGQRVENEFVGARVGIMDQMAASLASVGEALFLDTRDLSFRRVPLPVDRVDLVVINSGVQHSNVGGGYNERRAQCEEACRLLGVKQLRDLDVPDLARIEGKLPPLVFRRARHVITENARVLKAVAALEKGDLELLGQLFYESHRSMRDDYETSVPEIDTLVELARGQSEVLGARLTGGGFGGSMVVLARVGHGRDVADRVKRAYDSRVNRVATVLVP